MDVVSWPWPLLCLSLPVLFSSLVACSSILDAADKFLSLVIPAFNEEYRLPGTLDETMDSLFPVIVAYLFQEGDGLDLGDSVQLVIIVDDGSTDGTQRIAFDFVRKYTIDVVRLFPLVKNCGRGGAIRKGMLHARGELLLMMDADGATKVSDLEKLEREIKNLAEKDIQARKGADNGLKLGVSDVAVVVFGSRAHLEKRALATCGFKMFTTTAARKLLTNMRLKRWCFDVELVYLCNKFKIPMAEISVDWSEISGSKVRLTSFLHMLFELVLICVGYGLGIWKIHA